MKTLQNLLPSLALILLVAACGGGGEVVTPEDEASVAEAIEAYLQGLSKAYETGDLSVLEGLASEKEVAKVGKRISDVATRGRRISADLEEFTLESVDIWSSANAYATTYEVWDLRQFAGSSDVLLAEALDQPHRVKYQLKRRPGGWRVLYRQVPETLH